MHTKFSLAALKRRLTVGTVIYCTQNVKGPQDPPLYRRVVIQQNNAIACATKPESVGLVVKRSDLYWLYWPKKAASVRPIPGGFELDNDLHPDGFKLRYQFEVKP